MAGTLKKMINLAGNMGYRYVQFRVRYELMKKTGLLKSKFPSAPAYKQYISLQDWKAQKTQFFFPDKESIKVSRKQDNNIKERYEQLQQGKFLLFNSILTDLGTDYDWVTNPDSGHKYDISKHWTEIADYSKEAGDIKYVWEKSRFSYLYDIIRYDHHFDKDCAEQVFGDILSWIKSNPVNMGPNYRCSQEMSLRVLNWTFALHYYRNSAKLTEEIFGQVQYAIYWHMDHIYNNIDFSRIAVRNNHAITETLTLYLAGTLYPTLPNANTWKGDGKKWFEEEIAYQVYSDGTFLQHSMNYHRIVVQLLTWGIILAEKNGDRFSDVVYERAKASLSFLRTCMIEENGWLPNFGANDGALFFKLNNAHYRDYRPQLHALAAALSIGAGLNESEDAEWYGINKKPTENMTISNGTHSYNIGGYYIIREPETLTFVKCGSYKDRPLQADNLHIDIWYKGDNLLTDAGSYKYNTDEQTIRYFSGTQSHNTVMLDDNDQMLKGSRFIWYYWSECVDASLKENNDTFVFTGSVNAFKYIKEGIVHKRTITKLIGKPEWALRDEVTGKPEHMIRQLWHIPLLLKDKVAISAMTKGAALKAIVTEGWQSSLYGQKEKTEERCFSTDGTVIETIIKTGTDS